MLQQPIKTKANCPAKEVNRLFTVLCSQPGCVHGRVRRGLAPVSIATELHQGGPGPGAFGLQLQEVKAMKCRL
jgi:hypothetical protein